MDKSFYLSQSHSSFLWSLFLSSYEEYMKEMRYEKDMSNDRHSKTDISLQGDK